MDRPARRRRQRDLAGAERGERGRGDVRVLHGVRQQDARLERGPGHDQRHVELVGGEATVAGIRAGVLLERAGRGVARVHLIERPVVLREHHHVRLVRAVGAKVVEAPRPQVAVRRHRAGDVDAGERAALNQRDQLVGDVGLGGGAGGGARPVDARVELRVSVLVQDRVAGGVEPVGRALGGDHRAELAVRRFRAARPSRGRA